MFGIDSVTLKEAAKKINTEESLVWRDGEFRKSEEEREPENTMMVSWRACKKESVKRSREDRDVETQGQQQHKRKERQLTSG